MLRFGSSLDARVCTALHGLPRVCGNGGESCEFVGCEERAIVASEDSMSSVVTIKS